MTYAPPAKPGDTVDLVDTPALLIDLDAFEFNLEKMANFAADSEIALRPHAKAHKCPDVAKAQIRRGAIGLCCQKVSEAEALVAGGVDNILISNEIVSPTKLSRLIQLARQARISVCVDSSTGVRLLANEAVAAGVEVTVLVEIDIGQHRCGVLPGQAAVDLAQLIDATPGLRFGGLQAYHGSAQQIRAAKERSVKIQRVVSDVKTTIAAIEAAGLRCETVTGGGTGTFPLETQSDVYTEIQPGSYVFMDHSYIRNQPVGKGNPEFSPALFVLTEVMSNAVAGQVILDAGSKSISSDGGLPKLWKRDDLDVKRLADEHTTVGCDSGECPALGEKLWLVPGHCDTTVGLHDWFVCVRNGIVEAVWPITARGAIF